VKPFCGGVSVAGVGLRQYKRGTSPVPEQGVLVRAIVDACDEAGFDPAMVDGFVSYGDDRNEPVRLMPDLGTRELKWNAAVWGGGGGGIAGTFGIAAAAIATGQADAVVVFRALVQGNSGRMSEAVMRHHLNDHMLGAGLVSPAQMCALRAQRMFEHHHVPHSVTEELVKASYYHGARNPEAVGFGRELDIEAYRNGRWIAEPFKLFDCSRENDGAAALLLVSSERARDLKKKPVHVLGVANGTAKGWGDLLENDELYASVGFKAVAQRLWQQTGLTPADMDVVQLYENFSAQGVASLIDHGFCSYENVAEVVKFENLIAPSGKLPVNTSGGNFAQGFIHGIGCAIESVRVLRGESANNVPGATTCLLAGGPGAPTVSSAIFGTETL
jgi:acetyl-CoA acetyltransferase